MVSHWPRPFALSPARFPGGPRTTHWTNTLQTRFLWVPLTWMVRGNGCCQTGSEALHVTSGKFSHTGTIGSPLAWPRRWQTDPVPSGAPHAAEDPCPWDTRPAAGFKTGELRRYMPPFRGAHPTLSCMVLGARLGPLLFPFSLLLGSLPSLRRDSHWDRSGHVRQLGHLWTREDDYR